MSTSTRCHGCCHLSRHDFSVHASYRTRITSWWRRPDVSWMPWEMDGSCSIEQRRETQCWCWRTMLPMPVLLAKDAAHAAACFGCGANNVTTQRCQIRWGQHKSFITGSFETSACTLLSAVLSPGFGKTSKLRTHEIRIVNYMNNQVLVVYMNMLTEKELCDMLLFFQLRLGSVHLYYISFRGSKIES